MLPPLRAFVAGPAGELADAVARELAPRAEVVVAHATVADLGRALVAARPSHVFCLDPGWAEACLAGAREGGPTPPRLVLLATGPAAAEAARRVHAAGVPFTIARVDARLVAGEGDAGRSWQCLWMGPWLALATRLGLERLSARHAPLSARELAYGLVHAGLNYTTIDREVGPDELRYRLANDREYHVPRSRRDGRH